MSDNRKGTNRHLKENHSYICKDFQGFSGSERYGHLLDIYYIFKILSPYQSILCGVINNFLLSGQQRLFFVDVDRAQKLETS